MTRIGDRAANPYQRQIEEKKVNDGRVMADEANDLVKGWAQGQITEAQAEQLKKTLKTEQPAFTTAAKYVVNDFVKNVLPTLTLHEASILPKNSALLSWVAPAQPDGTPFPQLAGYRVLYGPSPSSLNKMATVRDATATRFQINNLAPGPWYFGMKSIGNDGSESELTNLVSKTVP